MRRFLTAAAAALLLGTGLSAAAVWEAKPFLQWTDKEAEKVMTDSPWAVTIGVALPPPQRKFTLKNMIVGGKLEL